VSDSNSNKILKLCRSLLFLFDVTFACLLCVDIAADVESAAAAATSAAVGSTDAEHIIVVVVVDIIGDSGICWSCSSDWQWFACTDPVNHSYIAESVVQLSQYKRYFTSNWQGMIKIQALDTNSAGWLYWTNVTLLIYFFMSIEVLTVCIIVYKVCSIKTREWLM